MAETNAIYKCSVCGNVAEMIHATPINMVCCEKEMVLQKENTVDAAEEKHVPVVEITDNKVIVKVGSVPHPMEEEHYIQLIEVMSKDKVIAATRLAPGEKPEAEFCLESTEGVTARAYCNLHGLWKS